VKDEDAEDAKEASVGACWAEPFRDRAVRLEDARDGLDRERTRVMIDVDNLTYTLPCAFLLQRLGADELELLSAGTPLAEIDDAGTIGIRSEWRGLTPDFQINRPLSQGESKQWGWFQFMRHAAREGFQPNEIWTLSSDAAVVGKVRAQLEVNVSLTPFLHLCHHQPQYIVPAPTVSLSRHFGERYWLESRYRLMAIPAAVWVRGQADKEHPEGEMELFPAWLPGPGDADTTFFPVFFRDSNDPYLEPRPGRISEQLPRPTENGEYQFFLRWPDGRKEFVHTERVHGRRGPTARFVATLDARGWLTIHRGDPPYWKASSLEGVQEHAGAVFRVEMEPGVRHLKDSWDPYNESPDDGLSP